MKRAIRILPDARADMAWLEKDLESKSPRAAIRAANAITAAIRSLTEYSDRGRPLGADVRELIVRFGRDGYVIRYRTRHEVVLITRVFHGRQRR
jgi:plasmid stabilization system protein ParE